jgi:ankyrin repeat protein
VEAVNILLGAGAPVDAANAFGFVAIHFALSPDSEMASSLAIIQLLIQHGANVDATTDEGYTPIAFAAQRQHLPVLRLLLSAGARLTTTAGFDAYSFARWTVFKKDEVETEAVTFIADAMRAGSAETRQTLESHEQVFAFADFYLHQLTPEVNAAGLSCPAAIRDKPEGRVRQQDIVVAAMMRLICGVEHGDVERAVTF